MDLLSFEGEAELDEHTAALVLMDVVLIRRGVFLGRLNIP